MSARLFSVPAFRFAVDTAIGKWSRFATFGPKAKDGAEMVFDATSLGGMVENAAKRGDPIAICADHASAYPETKDAPALGFFHALAVVAGGRVVKHWALDDKPAPDASGMNDGLWGRLGEVTPRGADPLRGLANYRSLSPLFSESAQDETGAAIGYALYDVAATNTPFQAGTALSFAMEPVRKMAMAPLLDCSHCGQRLADADHDGKLPNHNGPDGKPCPGSEKSPREGVTTMGGTVAMDFRDAARPRTKEQADWWAEALDRYNGGDRSGRIQNATQARIVAEELDKWRSRPMSAISGEKPPREQATQKGAMMMASAAAQEALEFLASFKRSGMDLPIARGGRYWAGIQELLQSGEAIERGGRVYASSQMSATPGAARRLAKETKMNPEQMAARFGWAPEDDDKAKLAKVMARLTEEAAAPAPVEPPPGDKPPVEMDVDPSNKEQNAAIHIKTGNVHDEGGRKASADVSTAVKFAAMEAELKILRADKAVRDKDAADAKEAEIQTFASQAVAAGYPEASKSALLKFARVDFDGAMASVSALMGRNGLTSRIVNPGRDSRATTPITGEVKAGRMTLAFGQGLAHAIKMARSADPKLSYEAAAAKVASEHPELVDAYHRGVAQ